MRPYHIAMANSHFYDREETVTPQDIIFKICDQTLWSDAEKLGRFDGAEIDITDGFIHFSTAEQLASTLSKHFAGRKGLALIAVDGKVLGEKIVYEEARGSLFPHLYGPLSIENVLWVKPLALDGNGMHILPDLIA